MFQAVSEREKYNFWNNNTDNFIPGYTGHCPTLRFQYGKSYGTNTKEILKNLREKEIYHQVQRHRYREEDAGKVILTPASRNKTQTTNIPLQAYRKCPKYILGYTGFIPTLNFRYGKSFGRTADDSAADFAINQSKYREKKIETQNIFRAKSTPRIETIRHRDDVSKNLAVFEEQIKFKGLFFFLYKYVSNCVFLDKELSPDYPPIAGYTGHIPGVKGNEESLSHRYNTVVKRGLTMLRKEREKRHEILNSSYKINEVIQEGKPRYTYVK
ncbi:hypothetical protein FQR65_LT05733 [Abscondita terminalis]|nr:hypothetical protein FQR65_LT05733 [Abscondita terminalis]